jgi:hypothetical protein
MNASQDEKTVVVGRGEICDKNSLVGGTRAELREYHDCGEAI